MTEKQLRKFIKIRNSSNFSSNMQFSFDAEAAGFRVDELGNVIKRELNDTILYMWIVPFGILVERMGTIRLFRRVS